ncbi:hypothetical protein CR956_01190 [Candidatus Saccharibacteria bacterium]|nr:MAG: hypothetical protein CR956_01190 [Candidatus Saccharibacteria bacterium]
MSRKVTDYSMYRSRYWVGNLVLLVVFIGILIMAGIFIPGQLRVEEIQTATVSSQLSFKDFQADQSIDLPYHMLQLVVFKILGLKVFTVKLISLMFGFAAVIGGYLLIKEWFSKNIAVIVSLFFLTSSTFIFMAQDATPAIYGVTLSIWLIFAATKALRSENKGLFWKVMTFILAAFSLYSPGGIWLILSIMLVAPFHPHVRQVLRKFNPLQIALTSLTVVIILVPLLYSLVVSPENFMKLTGLDFSQLDLAANLIAIKDSLFGVGNGLSLDILGPVLPIGFLIVALIGSLQLLKVIYTARSYITLIWGLMVLAVVIITPKNIYLIYPLIVILLGFGMYIIINSWYSMFPLNPYARVVGLLPIVAVVASLAITGVVGYANSNLYNPEVAKYYSRDLALLSDQLSNAEGDLSVVVTEKQRAEYQLYQKFNKNLILLDDQNPDIKGLTLVTADSFQPGKFKGSITEIITNNRSEDAARFYVYAPIKK